MASREFQKNSREVVRISPGRFRGSDRIDVRVFAKNKAGDFVATPKGVSLNVDQIPDLIDYLQWALQQPCSESEDIAAAAEMGQAEEDTLARAVYQKLLRHGVDVHWDIIERMVLDDARLKKFTKWQLHYVLAARKDLFRHSGGGCFKAI